jgi:hypothetical protein
LYPAAREFAENALLPERGAEPFEDRTGILEEPNGPMPVPRPAVNFPATRRVRASSDGIGNC